MNDSKYNSQSGKEPEIKLSNGGYFAKRFDNFWYYNKWKVIIAIAAVFIITICTVQMCTKVDPDVGIVYAGNYNLAETEYANVQHVLNGVLPEDFNKDGKKEVSLVKYLIFSEQELKDFNAETDKEGNKVNYYPSSNNSSQYSEFSQTLAYDSGYQIFMVSPSLYERVVTNNKDVICPTKEISSKIPDSWLTDDGLAVKLSETEIYKYYEVLHPLPEDTILFFMKQTVTTDDNTYNNARDMFRAMIEFSR